jgi:2-polyprenyl-3-methyl-5-hydroxy-6-metoxy-1,4-benzoquinol methylase
MNERNYNSEFTDNRERKYIYGFDYDIMHHYMLKSFLPFFKHNDVLELGCYKGAFTRRLQDIFTDITCIEASDDAINAAKSSLRSDIKFVHGTFEKVKLDRKFNNIIMTHVLEHIDDPILVLKRINDEWLADSGNFFLACPNANAPSRQIAVKMGLIDFNSAVTDGERKHGHRVTYTFDTLERDAKRAGFKIMHRSGIFFKALANFQWDKILQTDIVSKEYLDGCFELGQIYPDLCASIFLLCQKNE